MRGVVMGWDRREWSETSLAIDHDAKWFVERERVAALGVLGVEHDTCHLIRVPSQTHLANHIVIVCERQRRVAERPGRLGTPEIEEQP